MYEGDTPNAERRAAALSLDRDLLRELLGQEELRELIDPGALAAGRGRSPVPLRRCARRRRRDELHDVLRRIGDLTAAEAAARVVDGSRCGGDARRAERRAPGGAGADRRRGAVDRRRRRRPVPRRARGRCRRAGCRPRSSRTCPRRCASLVRRYAATHGPFTTEDLRARYGVDAAAVAGARSSATAMLVRGELRPGGIGREWCDPEVLRRLRRASLAVLRKEIEPADQRALARFLPAWQGVDRHPPPGRRASTACARCSCRSRGWRCRPTCGSATSCRGASAPTRRPGSTSCARAARSSGSAPARSGATPAEWRSTSATIWRCSGRRRRAAGPGRSESAAHDAVRDAPGRRGVLLHRPARRRRARARGAPGGAVGSRLGGRGDQRRVRAAAGAAADAGPRPA